MSSGPRSNGLNLGVVSVKAALAATAGGGARTGTGETPLGDTAPASRAAGLDRRKRVVRDSERRQDSLFVMHE